MLGTESSAYRIGGCVVSGAQRSLGNVRADAQASAADERAEHEERE